MHRVWIYSIGKKDDRCMSALSKDFIDNTKRFARVETHNIFNKKINQAQRSEQAQKIYEEVFAPYLLDDGFNIALHPSGKKIDSFEFATLLQEHPKIAFFIGGAYGFGDGFLQKCDYRLSLSPLTMSHKVARIVLLEQIFRGFSIINNHPYHK